ncbi:hypothetical protein C8R45DRAFT_946123 [Mycena sanguinolenta]|nr:hypothetical protein C8R45DRAFT_946123 [Mycena sanguinolenta]
MVLQALKRVGVDDNEMATERSCDNGCGQKKRQAEGTHQDWRPIKVLPTSFSFFLFSLVFVCGTQNSHDGNAVAQRRRYETARRVHADAHTTRAHSVMASSSLDRGQGPLRGRGGEGECVEIVPCSTRGAAHVRATIRLNFRRAQVGSIDYFCPCPTSTFPSTLDECRRTSTAHSDSLFLLHEHRTWRSSSNQCCPSSARRQTTHSLQSPYGYNEKPCEILHRQQLRAQLKAKQADVEATLVKIVLAQDPYPIPSRALRNCVARCFIALYTRACARDTSACSCARSSGRCCGLVGERMFSEQGHIGPIRELATVYSSAGPHSYPTPPRPAPPVPALREFTGLLHQLGNVPLPIQDAVAEPPPPHARARIWPRRAHLRHRGPALVRLVRRLSEGARAGAVPGVARRARCGDEGRGCVDGTQAQLRAPAPPQLLFCQNALPKPTNKDTRLWRGPAEWGFLLHVRESALGAVLFPQLQFRDARDARCGMPHRGAAEQCGVCESFHQSCSTRCAGAVGHRAAGDAVEACTPFFFAVLRFSSITNATQATLLWSCVTLFASPDSYTAVNSVLVAIAASSSTFMEFGLVGTGTCIFINVIVALVLALRHTTTSTQFCRAKDVFGSTQLVDRVLISLSVPLRMR